MLTNGRMAGIDVKIQRAREHLADVEARVAEFLRSEPFTLIGETEASTGDWVIRVRVKTQPPLELGAIVGDVIHNLRSALDLLMWQLVLACGGTPDRSTEFPISKDAQAFELRVKKLRGVNEAAKRSIRATKAYKGGNDLLWQLHDLDIGDKHHILTPVGAAHRNLIIDMGKQLGKHVPDIQQLSMPIALRPADRQYPLRDGTELFRVLAAAREFGELDPKFTFELAFGEGETAKDELVSTLRRLVDAVEQLVNSFRPLLQ